MNLGQIFDKFHKSIQESSGLSYSKLFADDLSQGDLIFAGMKQDHKVIREKDVCPKICNCADLRCQAQYSAERDIP